MFKSKTLAKADPSCSICTNWQSKILHVEISLHPDRLLGTDILEGMGFEQ